MQRKSRNAKQSQWEARRARVLRKIGRGERVQLTVFRSARHIYAQLVDGESGRTIGCVSTRSDAIATGLASTGNVEAAKKVGAAIAALARDKQIEKVVFNRNGFLYHGRVKALAEAAREAGLQF
ncbi:50S ribosomal protein L18 [Myxococcaceae bacterium]|jgi:large subunit ribosomal protein L18|nr:50S ribosomal protein L18 [Myxococcaceae bacterium]